MTIIDNTFIEWFKPNVSQLYGSHKNLGLPTFNVKATHHITRRIDYIFKTFKGKYGCIEFEHGDKYSDITIGAVQLEDFYRLQEKGMKILIDNNEIKVTLFLLATKYSKEGYLYKNDRRVIQTSGYSIDEPLRQDNNTIFQATRWMWRFCGRRNDLMEQTNPIGVSCFSVIGRSWDKEPQIELNGQFKFKIKEL